MADTVVLRCDKTGESHRTRLAEGHIDWQSVEKAFQADVVETKEYGLPPLQQTGALSGFTWHTYKAGEVIDVTVTKRGVASESALTLLLQGMQDLKTEMVAELRTPREGVLPALLRGMKDLQVEMTEHLKTSCEGLSDTVRMHIAGFQGQLRLQASKASTPKVKELLYRINLQESQDREIPCCTSQSALPELPGELQPYVWKGTQASRENVEKGCQWLLDYVCPAGTVVIPVQNQSWLEAHFAHQAASIEASKTDFLIVLDCPEVRALPDNPSPGQLIGILRYVISAYESKPDTFIRDKGMSAVWAQAVLESLAINYMAFRHNGQYWIPVFGGSFNEHIVVHAAPRGADDFILHAASQQDRNQPELAVRYIRWWLERSKAAVESALSGGADLGVVSIQAGRYQLQGAKRQPPWASPAAASSESAACGSGQQQPQESQQQQRACQQLQDEQLQQQASFDEEPDEEDELRAVENAYHISLLTALRDPRVYRGLGLSGPPHTISHASLEECMDNLQLVH